ALARKHENASAMRMEGERAVGMDDDQQVAVTADAVVAVGHDARRDGVDGASGRGDDVDAGVNPVAQIALANEAIAAPDLAQRDRKTQWAERTRTRGPNPTRACTTAQEFADRGELTEAERTRQLE